MTTKEAIDKAKAGDSEGQAYLYEETYNKAYYVALKYMESEQDALDVVQDAYVKAFTKIDKLRDDNFDKWLSSIVARTAIDALRKSRPELFTDISGDGDFDVSEHFQDDESKQPEVIIDKKETARLVQEIIGTLSVEQRICVTMYYIQDMSIREISEVLGVSANTVKSRLYYARNNIEVKVDELAKHGTKLYSLAAIPFFALLTHKEASACEMTAANGVYKAISLHLATSCTAKGAGAASGVSIATASTSASLGTKIAIGAVSALVVLGGAIGIGMTVHNNNTDDVIDESQVEKPRPEQDNNELLTEYYDNVLVGQYGLADSSIDMSYDEDEGEYTFLGFSGKGGIMGRQFVDIDGDGKDEMMLVICEASDVSDIRSTDDDGIITKVLIYKSDELGEEIRELTDGKIAGPNMKRYDDTLQCAYRVIDGVLYVYFTDVYTMDLHQGGMGYAFAMIYSYDGSAVNTLVDKPDDVYKQDDIIANLRQYMPTIIDAWMLVAGYNAYSTNSMDIASNAYMYAQDYDGTQGVLFAPLSKTDPEYKDLFTWKMNYEWDDSLKAAEWVGIWQCY